MIVKYSDFCFLLSVQGCSVTLSFLQNFPFIISFFTVLSLLFVSQWPASVPVEIFLLQCSVYSEVLQKIACWAPVACNRSYQCHTRKKYLICFAWCLCSFLARGVVFTFSLSFVLMPDFCSVPIMFVTFMFLDNFTLLLKERCVSVIATSNPIE